MTREDMRPDPPEVIAEREKQLRRFVPDIGGHPRLPLTREERLEMEDHGREPSRLPAARPHAAAEAAEAKKAIGNDISNETWREYQFPDGTKDGHTVVRIHNPKRLFMRPGGTTHRVLDGDGVVHVLPAPGHCGCALRYRPRNVDDWCQF